MFLLVPMIIFLGIVAVAGVLGVTIAQLITLAFPAVAFDVALICGVLLSCTAMYMTAKILSNFSESGGKDGQGGKLRKYLQSKQAERKGGA